MGGGIPGVVRLQRAPEFGLERPLGPSSRGLISRACDAIGLRIIFAEPNVDGHIKPANQMLNHFEQHPKLKARPQVAGPYAAGFVLLFVLCCTSCVPVESMIYLQPEGDTSVEVFEYDKKEYQLQMNDILDVKISSLNPDINSLFNTSTMGAMQIAQATAQTGGDLFYLTGYSVDEAGDVDIPFVGKVNVQGLTLTEAHSAIDDKVKGLFTNYHLRVKLGGIRFSALGEFNRPGKHVVMQNQVTVFEAIALSGDLSVVANRAEVRLIRQHTDGPQIHKINLLEEEVLRTPFYFIQPNDVLYAEPLPQKSWGVGVTGAQTISTITGALSTSAALILSILTLSR